MRVGAHLEFRMTSSCKEVIVILFRYLILLPLEY